MTRAAATAAAASRTWVAACRVDDVVPDTGVCVRVRGDQVAVFHLRDGQVFALQNRDPFSGANVLSRGIVGDTSGTPIVASPIYKQRFALATGRCVDNRTVWVRTYPVDVRDGTVYVGLED